MSKESHHKPTDGRELEQLAAHLLTSLKGVQDARVDADGHGRIVRVEIVPSGTEDRAACRNAQSALMAVLGQQVDVNAIVVVDAIRPLAAAETAAKADRQVLELKPSLVRETELNVAAKVAFDTLRAAQSSFHGFQFDGAELVRITGHQYVVVAVRRAATEARFCGAAPVIDSVSTASARALMNAVGAAAMGGSALDINIDRDTDQIHAINA